MHENDKSAQGWEPAADGPPLKGITKSRGPGIITGASDDIFRNCHILAGRSGIGILWLAIFQYPLMTAVQEICARIGPVTGGGLGAAIKKKYSKKVLLPIAGLLLAANTKKLQDTGSHRPSC